MQQGAKTRQALLQILLLFICMHFVASDYTETGECLLTSVAHESPVYFHSKKTRQMEQRDTVASAGRATGANSIPTSKKRGSDCSVPRGPIGLERRSVSPDADTERNQLLDGLRESMTILTSGESSPKSKEELQQVLKDNTETLRYVKRLSSSVHGRDSRNARRKRKLERELSKVKEGQVGFQAYRKSLENIAASSRTAEELREVQEFLEAQISEARVRLAGIEKPGCLALGPCLPLRKPATRLKFSPTMIT